MPNYENISNFATKLLIIYNTHNTSQNIFFKLPQQPLTARNPALLQPQSPWQEPRHRMTLTQGGTKQGDGWVDYAVAPATAITRQGRLLAALA